MTVNSSSDYFTRFGTSLQRRPDRSEHDKKVHAVFNLFGLLAGAAAAYLAWAMSDTISLPIFVFFLTSYLVGRGLGDLVTDPDKVRRFFYFVLPAAIDCGLLYVAYLWWDRMWLAVLVGFFVGAMVWAPVAALFFADIHGQEAQDTMDRMKEAQGS
jgi:hypothetical protein